MPTKSGAAEELLFDAYGADGVLSPDGKSILFTREGTRWWRKGYRGAQASQIWRYVFSTGEYSKLAAHPTGCRWPLWRPDGKGFYYVSGQSGSWNLWTRGLKSKKPRQLTHFADDSIVAPCISRDGSTIVFRRLFDLYRLKTGKKAKPVKLEITADVDLATQRIQRRTLSAATEVAFADDGLEIAFIAGGDLWVMDTELREPRQVTDTPEEESEPLFSPDGKTLLFVSDAEGQSDIWQARRSDDAAYWWQNREFPLQRLTNDAAVESDLKWSPDGEQLAFLRERGDLWLMKPDGKDARRVRESWNEPSYGFSPDGKWIVYSVSDNDFNRDVWLYPLDGSREPFNLSRHPDNDNDPVWSPDGKMIAFTGRRTDNEVDINFVYLRKEQHEEG